MPRPKRGSTLRAQWLGHMLRREREHAGLSHKDAGKALKRDGSTVSRMEAGVTPARLGDVLVLTRMYKTDSTRRTVLEQLSEEIWEIGWWETYANDVDGNFIDHAWLEDRAEKINSFDAVSIPGLLQTRAYAETIIVAGVSDASSDQLQRGIDYRMDRQRVLTKEHPPAVVAILDEAVLHRRIGGTAVLRSQLQHLREAAELPTVSIRVLPFEAGAHASPDGPFTIIELPEPFPPVGYVHGPAGAVYVEDEQAMQMVEAFTRIDKLALDPRKSTDLVDDLLRERP